MDKTEEKKIKSLFASGMCDQIPDEYIDTKLCQELHAQMSTALKKAGCKCKHKGIRTKYVSRFMSSLK